MASVAATGIFNALAFASVAATGIFNALAFAGAGFLFKSLDENG